MPSISFGEVLVILLVTVLFVKPEELPAFLRRIGRLYGQFLAYIDQVRGYGRDTYHHVTTLDQPVKDALHPTPPPAAPAPPPVTAPAAAPLTTAAAPPLLPRPAPAALAQAPASSADALPPLAPASSRSPSRPAVRRSPRLYGPPQRRRPPAGE